MIETSLPIILGSSSKYRQKILKDSGLRFTILIPDIDEKAVNGRDDSNPSQTAFAVANAKADELIKRIDYPCLLICSDQVVSFNGKVREKPESKDEAVLFLKSYNDKHPAETHSAVVVINTQTGKRVEGIDIAQQYFKEIPNDIVDALIVEGDILWCAGGFLIDSPIILPYLCKRVGDVDSIIGMPLKLTMKLIKSVNVTS